jgi:glycosyltransferase involved in cell wall biosynthesis
MRVSIGILAHNEERVLGRTIDSIRRQTLVTGTRDLGVELLELVIVPNGCRDGTVGVARAALASFASAEGRTPLITTKVQPLDRPGKSGAWNRYVHEFSDEAADYLILMDADVRFGEEDTLERLVRGLHETPSADAAVDTPLKLMAPSGKWDVVARFSIAISGVPLRGKATIAGSLYCIRAEVARRIWMPIGLPVEDGFVKAMLNTGFFTRTVGDYDSTRIIRIDGATHYFEPQTRLATALRHEQRMLVGAVINNHIYSLLWAKGRETPVGAMIRDLNEQNPNWLRELCNAELDKLGYWRVPRAVLFRRFRELRQRKLKDAIRNTPIAVVGTLLSLAAAISANRTLRNGNAVGFW